MKTLIKEKFDTYCFCGREHTQTTHKMWLDHIITTKPHPNHTNHHIVTVTLMTYPTNWQPQ